MKVLLVCLMMTAIASQLPAQDDHIAPCTGASNHSTGQCWGYAVGRVGGKTKGDICDPTTLNLGAIPPQYFNETVDSSLADISSHDIVSWRKNNHVAFLLSKSDDVDDYEVQQYTSGSGEQTLKISDITEYGELRGYWQKKNITISVKNKFGDTGGDGGIVYVNDVQQNSPASPSVGWVLNNRLKAKNLQDYAGYVWVFDHWERNGSNISSNLEVEEITRVNKVYTAVFNKASRVNFKNEFKGIGPRGVIKVDGTQYDSPTPIFIVEAGESITAQALNQTYQHIRFIFNQWNDGNTSSLRTFTPSGNATFTAKYVGKPVAVTITSYSGPEGTPVVLQWQEHPNGNVSEYHVWRKIKWPDGHWEGPTRIKILNRGTTSYTDTDFNFTDTYSDKLLQYDIRAYYSVEQTTAQENWVTVYGEGPLQKHTAGNTQNPGAATVPTEYALGNYPNPFNPETRITFQLVAGSRVKLALYNLQGQQVRLLVDEHLPQGFYTYTWDGRDAQSRPLSSGIYLARLLAGSNSGERRVLTHRMLLMK